MMNATTIIFSSKLAETVVKGIMENFPEASSGSALACTKWKYEQWRFVFDDQETNRRYELDKKTLLAAFPLLFTGKWPKGCTQPPARNDAEAWEDWLCQCDATDFDAFAQLVCLGEVIYG